MIFNQDPYPLTDDKVAFYRANGFVRFDGVLSQEEVETMRAALADAIAHRKGVARDLANDGTGDEKKADKILQMVNLWEHSDVIKAYSENPRLARIAAALTGSEQVHLFHDQALVKPPGPSAPSPWHQDQPYWPSKEPGMLSCWMALDDVTDPRGCMQFIPGSHLWGEYEPVSFTGEGDQLFNMVDDEKKKLWNAEPIELKAGDCTWHHGLTFHFTNANTTPQTRRAMVTIYIPDGISYAADEKMEHPLSPTITSKKGEPLRGTAFTRLL